MEKIKEWKEFIFHAKQKKITVRNVVKHNRKIKLKIGRTASFRTILQVIRDWFAVGYKG